MIKKHILTTLVGVLFLTTPNTASENQEIFYLKDGSKISGSIKSFDEGLNSYIIETKFGEVTLKKDSLQPQEVTLWLKNGDKVQGIIDHESDTQIKINTSFGLVIIEKNSVDRIEFKSKFQSETAQRRGESNSPNWYYGEEQLASVFQDPTGYTFEDNVLYISGLSWGYGLSPKFQIKSRYWEALLLGNLNIKPKYQFYRKGNIDKEAVASIELDINTHSAPWKYRYKDEKWTSVGEEKVTLDTNYKEWYAASIVYTSSTLRKSKKGRINHTVGATLTYFDDPNYAFKDDLMPRIYYANSIDAKENLKLIVEVFYDPYFPNTYQLIYNKNKNMPLDLDLGFVYAYNENVHLGIHYQSPFFVLYIKF